MKREVGVFKGLNTIVKVGRCQPGRQGQPRLIPATQRRMVTHSASAVLTVGPNILTIDKMLELIGGAAKRQAPYAH